MVATPSKTQLARWKTLHTRKGRERTGRFLAEGWNLIEEAAQAGLACHGVAVLEGDRASRNRLESLFSKQRKPICLFQLGANEFAFLADTQTPQGVLAEFDLPPSRPLDEIARGTGLLVVLDEVQDPGNVGTALRCSAGLGAQGLVCTAGCADLFNPKTLRSTSGMVFRIPFWEDVRPTDLESHLKGCILWIATAAGQSLYQTQVSPGPLAIVFGNEARGPSPQWRDKLGGIEVGLPLSAGVESLNVGATVAAFLAVLQSRRALGRAANPTPE